MVRPFAGAATLAGVRIGLVGEPSAPLGAIEEQFLEQLATVERIGLAGLDGLTVDRFDAVVVHLPSAASRRGGSKVTRAHEFVRSLSEGQRVIGLLEDPTDPLNGLRDFVLPPFQPLEVVARLKRVLLEPRSPQAWFAGNLAVNVVNRTVTVAGDFVDVTFQEFELLRALIEAGGRVMTRADLARQLGETAPRALSRRMDIHVHRLRSKLAALEDARIETVRNVGYRLTQGF